MSESLLLLRSPATNSSRLYVCEIIIAFSAFATFLSPMEMTNPFTDFRVRSSVFIFWWRACIHHGIEYQLRESWIYACTVGSPRKGGEKIE